MMTERRAISLSSALFPLGVLVALLIVAGVFAKITGEFLVTALLVSAACAGVIATRHGATWDDIQRVTGEKFASVLPVILILLSIGMLIASWEASGTIPFLVYWGIRLIRADFIVLTAFLATALMSLATGTSWGSAATMGVALMGMATALHAPAPVVAGAVLSGSYFGDKMSPLSDSTNICAIAANVPLYRSIRHLLYTAVPSFLCCVTVYSAAAKFIPVSAGELPQSAQTLLAEISGNFSLSLLVLIPPIVVIWSIVRGVSPALAISVSSLVAGVIAVVLQHFSIADVASAIVAGFRTVMLTRSGVHAFSAPFVTLVQRGGLYSMSTTLVVIIAAFLLAAGMELSGAIELLIRSMLRAVTSVFRLIAATMSAGATMIALTSHGGVTALVVGGMFQDAYRERGLAPENLSRSLEDSVSITEPLMPWTVSAIFMATTLGVPTVRYAPWAVFCYGGPIFSLLIAALYRRTGYGIKPLAESNK